MHFFNLLTYIQNFVLSYQYDKGTVSLGLNVNAPVGAAIKRPVMPQPEKHSHGAKIGIAIAIMLSIVLGIIVAVWYYIDRKRQRDHETKAMIYAEVEKYGEVVSNSLNSSQHDKPGKKVGREQERRASYQERWEYKKGQERLNLIGEHENI